MVFSILVFSILRCISQKKVAGNSLRCIFPGIFSSGRMVSTVNFSSDESPIRISSASSPLLMIPSDKDDKVYKLHSLAGNEVLISHLGKPAEEGEFRCASKIVGSSHGWLALFDESEVSLYNPLSGRRINLPPIPQGHGCVEKVIISCSPQQQQEEDCRAVMRLGTEGKGALAFCCPRRSTDWTMIGQGKYYKDVVYSGTYKLLFCFTEEEGLEGWDLGDPLSPRLVWSVTYHGKLLPQDSDSDSNSYSDYYSESESDFDWDAGPDEEIWKSIHNICSTKTEYLVASQEKDEIFLVYRYTTQVPGKIRRTTGFEAWKIVRDGENGGKMTEMKRDLDGLVMFVGGVSHGVAVAGESDGFPPPNSICFSEDKYAGDSSHGIFDYETTNFRVSRRAIHPPLWIHPYYLLI